MESFSSEVSLQSSSSTPVKSSVPSVVAAKSAVAEDILTPEKPAEVRRPLKKRGVAYSLKEVRKIATSLRQSPDVTQDRKERSESDRAVCSTTGEGVRKRLPSKPVVQLSETCEKLLEFFNSLTSSIRLLRLKGYPTYFSKISRQVESLTNRRFSHGHLAQLKYILPDVICVKKILVHDETTSCIKPDLQIILQTDVFEDQANEKKGNNYHKLTQIFRSKLVEFSLHEKEVPEAELPEPFNQTTIQNITPTPSSQIQDSSSSAAISSHLPSSFTRRFSRKAQDIPSYQAKLLVSESSPSAPDRTPLKILSAPERTPSKILSARERTPSKILSTPLKPVVATPDVQTPKRFLQERRPTRTKLFHTPVKEEAKEKNEEEEEGEKESSVLKFLPKSLLQSVRAKEKRAREEQEDDVAASKRRKKMLSCLPKLFNSLRLLFQSANCSVITRQELLHKILSCQCDVLDRREVEDQLSLLLQILPDWISAKTSSAGDSLLCINKTCDPDVIRRRLAEAE